MSKLLAIIRRAKSQYHKMMHAYNLVLYRDCNDIGLKSRLLQKVKHHEQRMK